MFEDVSHKIRVRVNWIKLALLEACGDVVKDLLENLAFFRIGGADRDRVPRVIYRCFPQSGGNQVGQTSRVEVEFAQVRKIVASQALTNRERLAQRLKVRLVEERPNVARRKLGAIEINARVVYVFAAVFRVHFGHGECAEIAAAAADDGM